MEQTLKKASALPAAAGADDELAPITTMMSSRLMVLANEPEIDDNVNDLHLGMIVLCWQT